jgi:hypothetical protein
MSLRVALTLAAFCVATPLAAAEASDAPAARGRQGRPIQQSTPDDAPQV